MANGVGWIRSQHQHHQSQQYDHLLAGNFGTLPHRGFKRGISLNLVATNTKKGCIGKLHLEGVRDDGGRVGHDYVPQLQIQDVQDVATLGAGGAGTILKCRHKSLGKVAVKVPLTNNQTAAFFQRREAIVLAGLGASAHEGKEYIINAFTIDDQYWSCPIVMPLALGDLWQVNRDGFDVNQLLGFAKDMLRGLKFLHKNNIVHCDVKLRNLLVFLDNNGEYCAKVADLGLATVTGAICVQKTGTAGNIAPENYFGANEASPERDVFAAGVVMANMLFPKLLGYSYENIFVSKDTVTPAEKVILDALWKNNHHALADELQFELQKLVTGRVMMERGLDKHLQPANLHAFVPPRFRRLMCKQIRLAIHPEQLVRPTVDTLMAAVETTRRHIPVALPAPRAAHNVVAAAAAAAAAASRHSRTAALGLPQSIPSTTVIGAVTSFSVHRGADGRGSVPATAGSSAAAAAVSAAAAAAVSPTRAKDEYTKTYVAAGNDRAASRRLSPPAAAISITDDTAKRRSVHVGVDGQSLGTVPEGSPVAGVGHPSPARSGGESKTVSTMEVAYLVAGDEPPLSPSLAGTSTSVSSEPPPSLRDNAMPTESDRDDRSTISGDNVDNRPRTSRRTELLNSFSGRGASSWTAEGRDDSGWSSGNQPFGGAPRPESQGGWGVWGQVARGPPRPESEGGWGDTSCVCYSRSPARTPTSSMKSVRPSGAGYIAQRPVAVVTEVEAAPYGPSPTFLRAPELGLATGTHVYRPANRGWIATSGGTTWVTTTPVTSAAAGHQRMPDHRHHGMMAARGDRGGTVWRGFPTPIRTARRVDTIHANRPAGNNGEASASRSSACIGGWDNRPRCMAAGQGVGACGVEWVTTPSGGFNARQASRCY